MNNELIDDIVEVEVRAAVARAIEWQRESHATLCEQLAEALGDDPELDYTKQLLRVAALSIRLQI